MFYAKAMKSAFAMLFSLVLIATQTAFMVEGPGSASAPGDAKRCACERSRCEKPCCVSQGAPAPLSLPTLPARAVSQPDWQLSVAAQAAPDLAALQFTPRLPFDSSVLSMSAIPLYRRNCSYLI